MVEANSTSIDCYRSRPPRQYIHKLQYFYKLIYTVCAPEYTFSMIKSLQRSKTKKMSFPAASIDKILNNFKLRNG